MYLCRPVERVERDRVRPGHTHPATHTDDLPPPESIHPVRLGSERGNQGIIHGLLGASGHHGRKPERTVDDVYSLWNHVPSARGA